MKGKITHILEPVTGGNPEVLVTIAVPVREMIGEAGWLHMHDHVTLHITPVVEEPH